MDDFLNRWQRNAAVVTLAMSCLCSCAKSLTTPPSTRSASEAKTSGIKVDIKLRGQAPYEITGGEIEYRVKDGMIRIGAGKLSIDGQILMTLEESDLVTIEDSETVSVNGVRVWPKVQD